MTFKSTRALVSSLILTGPIKMVGNDSLVCAWIFFVCVKYLLNKKLNHRANFLHYLSLIFFLFFIAAKYLTQLIGFLCP